jgi:methionyl-tRNA formyltransferase
MPIKTIFMGSSEFSVYILEKLAVSYPIYAVITQPDKPAGRGNSLASPPVKVLAQKLGIPVLQPVKLRSPEAFEQLTLIEPDLIVVAAYGQILRQNVLDLPQFGCINVHASLLPRWRGASPIQAAILHGDTTSGVTIMKMDAGVDTGPILAKKEIEITPDETSRTLSEKLAELGGTLLARTLPVYLEGSLKPDPQDDSNASYSSIIKKEDGILDFNDAAVLLEQKIRALIDWPGTYFLWNEQYLKVRKAKVVQNHFETPGTRLIVDGYPVVATSEGSLQLIEVQPAGKKWMDGRDFLRGARNW